MVRVMHIVGLFGLGGAETLLLNIIRLTKASGYKHHILTIAPRGYYWEEPLFQNAGATVQGIDLGHLHEMNPAAPFRILRVFLDIKPDIVHYHICYAHLWILPIIKLAGWVTRHKVVCINTIHSFRIHTKPYKRRILEAAARHFISCQIAVSHQVRSYHSRTYHVPEKDIVVVENGVDTKQFDIRGSISDVRKLVTVANLTPEIKGYEDSLRAFALLAKKYPKLRYHIAGVGKLEGYIQRFSEKSGILERVIMHGLVRNIPEFLSDKDIFVLASRREGFGLSVVEAMAAGLPVVATRAGGLTEVLDGGKFGLLVDTRSPEQIADAVEFLIEHPGKRREMQAIGRRRAEYYDIRRTAAGIKDVYRHFLNKGKREDLRLPRKTSVNGF